jgi:hypothetical protein
MRKSTLNKVVILAAAAVAAGSLSITLFSTGVAGASPDMTGKTFSQAQAALSQAGYTAVASIAIGDKQSQANCKVVRQQDLSTSAVFVGGDQPTLYPIRTPAGTMSIPTAGQVLLTLACYGAGNVGQGQATGSGDITTKPSS